MRLLGICTNVLTIAQRVAQKRSSSVLSMSLNK